MKNNKIKLNYIAKLFALTAYEVPTELLKDKTKPLLLYIVFLNIKQEQHTNYVIEIGEKKNGSNLTFNEANPFYKYYPDHLKLEHLPDNQKKPREYSQLFSYRTNTNTLTNIESKHQPLIQNHLIISSILKNYLHNLESEQTSSNLSNLLNRPF